MKKPDDKSQDLFGDQIRKPADEMNPFGKMTSAYMQELKRRTSESRAYKSYQLTGLEIANILEDWEHKALYMRLAKVHGESKMMQLAKNVVERKNIENKGAYFMSVLKSEKSGVKKKWPKS